ncbi:unnamed protein product [Nippostrongylus brasiliensis]|uniref:DUF1707 domain-containing protein n=1 Tax=Nippostrongylus brasiliensis TaxID=27835 RepID=A0A0N4Y8V5_NIPBR|nr:hypothetical protein Q1695_014848 [Nippostrongylus brasiliensis]VDL76276.1 unnamed protein product [Nippostrongylus brasiliensis]
MTGQDPQIQTLEEFVARLRNDVRYFGKLDNPASFEQAVSKAQMVEQLLTEAVADRLMHPGSVGEAQVRNGTPWNVLQSNGRLMVGPFFGALLVFPIIVINVVLSWYLDSFSRSEETFAVLTVSVVVDWGIWPHTVHHRHLTMAGCHARRVGLFFSC